MFDYCFSRVLFDGMKELVGGGDSQSKLVASDSYMMFFSLCLFTSLELHAEISSGKVLV